VRVEGLTVAGLSAREISLTTRRCGMLGDEWQIMHHCGTTKGESMPSLNILRPRPPAGMGADPFESGQYASVGDYVRD
jgi:hypothetical protein